MQMDMNYFLPGITGIKIDPPLFFLQTGIIGHGGRPGK